TGSWDFLAIAAQKLAAGDSYFESTPSNYSQSIGFDSSDGQYRQIFIGNGSWVGIIENGVEVASTCCRAPNETIPVHIPGDRYRLEFNDGKLLYVKYRAGVRRLCSSATPPCRRTRTR